MSKNSVCFINLKGGVGKSTLSVAFAEYLAFVKEQKVLLIDGDPQCNSTAMMVSPEEAQKLDKNHKTLFDLIKTILQGGQQIAFERYIIQNVSNIDGENAPKLDLIPSTIRFADWENMLLREMSVTYKDTNQLHRTIGRIIDKLEEYSSDNYDWVVVDAPPSFGNQARLVMRLARFAVIPTTPDPLACHGTNFVIDNLRRYSLRTAAACVVISKFREQSDTAKKFKSAMLEQANPPVEEKWPPILKTVIPEAAALQRISDFHAFEKPPKSFRQKYGDKTKAIADMSEEILRIISSYQVALG